MFTAIRSTRGVIDFVRFGPYPKEIPSELVAALKQYDLQRDLGAEQLVHTNLRKMKKMKKSTDIEAVFNEINGEHREGMFMQLLSQYGIGTGATL